MLIPSLKFICAGLRVADYSHPLEVRYHWLSPLTRNSVTDAERCHANGRYALSHLMNMLLKYDFVGDAE